MDSYPNPYAALIATFNQVSPLESKDDLEDTQHLPDDDLLLWANAQFTYDIPPGVGIYEDDMGVKLAMSQQQFQQTQQQQQQQPQQQQQQQRQQQPFQQQQSQSVMTSQAQDHSLQYQSTDMQRQMQQFDAIQRYLDVSSEDPRTSLSVVERSRQRNPVLTAGPSQQSVHYNSIYPQGHAETTPFSTPVSAGPISPAAARLLRQPILALQYQQQQQQQPYTVDASPLSSPTTMSDFRQLQINPPPSVTSKPSDDVQAKSGIARKEVASVSNSPANSTTSVMANISSPLSPVEEKPNLADSDAEDYEDDQDDQDYSRLSNSGSSKVLRTVMGLAPDDPEYATKLAAEEDKRRRNTAASARFRHKKRLREQILEKTAKEMTTRSELLEARVRELEMEIKWLRGLIVEKDSRMLDVGISSSSRSSFSTTSPSSSPLSVAVAAAAASSLSSSLPTVSSITSSKGSKAEGSMSATKKRGKKAKA
ncbi:hypothetical protein BGZ58_001440 [Dissophora ornata]|nr:hypothetical protein BGZ58_001440 [Dissophora ornata]